MKFILFCRITPTVATVVNSHKPGQVSHGVAVKSVAGNSGAGACATISGKVATVFGDEFNF